MAPLPPTDGTAPASAAGVRPLGVGDVVGHFEIVGRVGAGGMGVVHLARDLRLGRAVALKVLPPGLAADDDARARLLAEARAASALDHPNIASVYEVSEADDGRPFIAMAYYEGETVAERLRSGPLDPEAALDVIEAVALGLGAAHRSGIVHRDVKPANVIVTTDGQVKVLDFGIAKVEDAELTRTGDSLGTAAYMSPEQASGEPAEPASDVWSAGALLHEMLTGQRPFGGAYAASALYAVLHTDPPPPSSLRPEVGPEVDALVARCLAKAPAGRYTNGDALAEAVRSLRTPTTPVPGPPRGRAMPRWPVLVGVATLLLAALVGAWALRGSVLGADEHHLAVLPFRVLGPADDAETYTAGLLETITSRLSQLDPGDEDLWVVPASEVEAGMSASDVRDRLGVTLAVDGTIQFDVGRVRLTLNLIDTRTLRQLGSRQIDYDGESALALQDEAVLRIADLLRVDLRPEAEDALKAGGTRSTAANGAYLRGWGVLRSQTSIADLERAAALFENALAEDPAFALAYAGLGEAAWQLYRQTDDVAWADRAEAAAHEALALDDRLAQVHVTLALLYAGQQRFDLAHASLDRAEEIAPSNSEVPRRRGKVYEDQGDVPRAEAAFEQSIALAPDYWRGYNSLGILYLGAGRMEDALAQFELGRRLAPGNVHLLQNVGVAAWSLGRLDEGADVFERIAALEPDNETVRFNLSVMRFYQGRYDAARDAFTALAEAQPTDGDLRRLVAEAAWWAGDRDAARSAYRESIDLTRPTLAVGRDDEAIARLADVYATLGQSDSARAYLRELEDRLAPETAEVGSAFAIGLIHEKLGDRPEAVRWMRAAIERGYGTTELQRSPWLASLRRSSSYSSLLDATP